MEETKMSCDSEGKELVLVQIMGIDKSDLYVVDLEAQKLWRKPIATLFNDFVDQHIVRLGSVIYNVGGPARPDINLELKDDGEYIYTGVSCLELSKPILLLLLKGGDAALCEDDDLDNPFKSRPGLGPWSGFGFVPIQWKVAPNMCCERRFAHCASLGGKIYALGGLAETSIGEVFTPECGEWNLLPPPPADVTMERFCVSSPVLADEKNERLIVHFTKAYALYAYYPADGRWDCIARKFNRRWKGATTVVDGVVYSFFKGTRDCLVAFDVATKSWLKVVYPSGYFHRDICISRFSNMLHLSSGDGNGNVLCLANSCPRYKGVETLYTSLQFVKFRVERTSPTGVHVTPGAVPCFAFEKNLSSPNFIAL